MRIVRRHSPLERALICLLWVTLLGLMLGRLSALTNAVEQTQVVRTGAELRSALHVEVMRRIAAGQRRDLAALHGSNPVLLLPDLPSWYGGDASTVSAGSRVRAWYFNSKAGVLRYSPSPFFEPDDNDSVTCWRVVVSDGPTSIAAERYLSLPRLIRC
ncbi:MAG: hypothetical protein SVU69_08835 [Pseudomonadota bacterium]|nr:hypothetical protein [Pseudomonadota bacterium]